jgi:hypothetical protein
MSLSLRIKKWWAKRKGYDIAVVDFSNFSFRDTEYWLVRKLDNGEFVPIKRKLRLSYWLRSSGKVIEVDDWSFVADWKLARRLNTNTLEVNLRAKRNNGEFC